ncbi:MAG TPA: DUF547 domain-containing protein [Candidatus Polarisedimenticolaceae bacterium]|nr:DUF547 domain-containing protein [Candidatus Polarisedimenticolaceae bacterium]
MRRLLAASASALLLAISPAAADLVAANRAYGALLGKYVTPRGVRYDAWRADGADLKTISEVVTLYRGLDPAALGATEREAVFLNLYNAKVLEIVLMANPRSSIRDLSKGMNGGEIFSRPVLNVGGKTISLNELEKRLREETKDPRIHFALNCAARSCPPIRREPYTADRLSAQLDEAVRDDLASPGAIDVVSHAGRTTLTVSRLFDWYADDFESAGGALAFLRTYAPAPIAEAIGERGAKLEFHEYDWSLNESK